MDILKGCPEELRAKIENWVNNAEFKGIDPDIQKIIDRDFWKLI